MRERINRPDRKYAAIPNDMMRDTSISMDARGLLALLMTYADDWVFRKDHLMEVTGWGRDKFEAAMRSLRDAGYVEVKQQRSDDNRLAVGTTWIIRDNRGPENPGVRQSEALKNRPPEKQTPGKSAPIRRSIDQEDQKSKKDQSDLFGESAEKADPKCDLEAKAQEFWAAYPKCERKTDRPKAMSLFSAIASGRHKTIPKTDPDVIIAGARAFAACGDDPAYMPLPTTWLNGARWERHSTLQVSEAPRGEQWRGQEVFR